MCRIGRNNQQISSLSQEVVSLNGVHISPGIIIMFAWPGQRSAPCRWQDGRWDIFGSVGQRHTLIIGYSWEWNRGGHKFDPLSILMQPRDARDKFFLYLFTIYVYKRALQQKHTTDVMLLGLSKVPGSRHVWRAMEIEITKMISMPRKY